VGDAGGDQGVAEPWRDPSRPVAERAADLLGRMTLTEKLAQLGSVWIGASGDGDDGVAPMQHEFSAELPPAEDLLRDGMGQLTRVFGTRPVLPAVARRPGAAPPRLARSLASRAKAAGGLRSPYRED